MSEERVQVRSEETGLRYFRTVVQAFKYAEEDRSVWKVSFETAAGERVRFVRSPEVAGWRYEDLMDAVKKTLG
jgi:hypothetical protein